MSLADRLDERVDHLVAVVEETRDLARATNGRVTVIERWRVELDAREDERRKLAARHAARAAAAETRRAARRSWVTGALVPVACLLIGAGLERWLFG